jgi:hypothetical protein
VTQQHGSGCTQCHAPSAHDSFKPPSLGRALAQPTFQPTTPCQCYFCQCPTSPLAAIPENYLHARLVKQPSTPGRHNDNDNNRHSSEHKGSLHATSQQHLVLNSGSPLAAVLCSTQSPVILTGMPSDCCSRCRDKCASQACPSLGRSNSTAPLACHHLMACGTK